MSSKVKEKFEDKIILSNKFSVKKIQIINNPISNRKTKLEIEQSITENWIKYYPKADEIDIWNYTCYRLNEFCIQNDELFLELSTIKYKECVGLKTINNIYKLGSEYSSKKLSISGLIKTSDNKFIFIDHFQKQKLELFEINLFKDKYDINSGFDLCEVYLNEINNNLRISQFYIKNTLFLGIILANSSDIKLIFNIELNINSSTVEKLFEDKSYKNKLVFIDEENLRRFFHSSLKGYQKLVYDLI